MGKEYVYNNSIILLGPVGVGKSTISDELTRVFELPQISLDTYRKMYYPKYGFDQELSKKLLKADPMLWLKYQKQFEIRLVEDVLKGLNEPAIIDFGATQSHYFDEVNQQKIAQLLDPFKFVIAFNYPSYAQEYAETKPLNKGLLLDTKQYENLAKYSFVCDIFKCDDKGVIVDSAGNGIVDYMKVRRQTDAIVDRYRFVQSISNKLEK